MRRRGVRPLHILFLAVLLCAVCYVCIRVPEIRNGWLSLTPHRWRIHQAVVRQELAPRSVLLSGVVIGGLGVGLLLFRRFRTGLTTHLDKQTVPAFVFVVSMVVVSVAVAINLQAYYFRQYGKPVWNVSHEEALNYSLPHMWKASLSVKELGPQARIALDTDEQFLFWFPALNYPQQFYRDFSNPEWPSSPAFNAYAKQKNLTHIVRYFPFSDDKWLRVEPLK